MWRFGLVLLLALFLRTNCLAQIDLEIRRPTLEAAQHEAYDHFLAHLQNRGFDWRPSETEFRRKALADASVRTSDSTTTLRFRLPEDERLAQWRTQSVRGKFGFYIAGAALLAALAVWLVCLRMRRP